MLFTFADMFEKFFFWRVKPKEEPIVEEIIEELKIEKLNLAPNPRYQTGKLWGYRPTSMIEKIIVHQELAEGDTIAVHNYHISNESHLKTGGAPKICYHYTIEKNGTVYLVNDHTDIVWHCRGENLSSIGIMMCGDFDGTEHIGKSEPTENQLESLGKLLDILVDTLNLPKTSVYGHTNFGKPACPGYEVMKFINKYKG